MEKVTGEGAQILFDILLIADHCEDLLEDPRPTPLSHRDREAGLNHQGQESQCF